MKSILLSVAGAAAVGALAGYLSVGCTPAKEAAAGTSYEADLTACVSDAEATYEACKRHVEMNWGRLDGGRD